MATLISHSAAETEALGAAWGRAAERGLVIGLCGELGAGKTQLAKGLAHGLGVSARVHSPTFALVNIYTGGKLRLFHLDLYRLETPEQIIAAGLEESFRPDGVSVVEWAERWFGNLGRRSGEARGSQDERIRLLASAPTLRWVTLETINETERRITYEDLGA